MDNIVPLKTRESLDLLPLQASKLGQVLKFSENIFERWGYLPVIPSLYRQPTGEPSIAPLIRTSLSKEMTRVIQTRLADMILPARYCYGGVIATEDRQNPSGAGESYEVGVEFVGFEALTAEAEVISIALELLKTAQIKEVRLTIGHQAFLEGLLEGNIKGAKQKVGILKGNEEVFGQAEHFASHKKCAQAIEDLKLLSRVLREFGHKDPIYYDLDPFMDGQSYASTMFRLEVGDLAKVVLQGGRRQGGGFETVGFSCDARELLTLIEETGMTLPSPKIDFLLINRKKSRKSSYEIMRVLREYGYSVVLDHSDMNRDDLLEYARGSSILNLMIVGDEDMALNEVRLIDSIDKISTKISISEIFDKKSGINKLLRYHKKLELRV